ncbi:MAG: pyruvate formate lyase family protein [Clostridiaceae bacterium]|nr:pyruvate formate lyase family protein [Clostridiaceae bacterium]
MNETAAFFMKIDEPYAAGFFEAPDRGLFYRYARAHRRYLEALPCTDAAGGLYPSGRQPSFCAVRPSYSYTVSINERTLEEKSPDAARLVAEGIPTLPLPPAPHNVAGAGYTHSIPNYERVAKEGLCAYETRVRQIADEDMRDGLGELLCGIRDFHTRSLAYLRNTGAPSALIAALQQVPFHPARTLYEALVCRNFVFYLDGCDNPGRVDAELAPYDQGEDIGETLRVFFRNVDDNEAWTMALGPDYSRLTLLCLQALRGLRRPNTELRVTDDIPDEIWDAALSNILDGGGNPALYHEAMYQRMLRERFPDIPAEDRLRFCGGGCTETMFAGLSNVGSLDAGVNLALLFANYLRESLPGSADFDEFYRGYLRLVEKTVAETCDAVSRFRGARESLRPQPMRSLLIDDCIDRGKDYNAGGARYAWSIVNLAGLINTVDSLLAVRAAVFERHDFTAKTFLNLLDEGGEAFYRKLRMYPHFGVNAPEADRFAHAFSHAVFGMFEGKTPYLGRAFLPSSIQFLSYEGAGQNVAATPDGRRAGEPLCDSVAAVHGKDTRGPTSMLLSCAALDQENAPGTVVLHLRIAKTYLPTSLRALTLGYFAAGGMQLQVTCQSREDLLDALEHPERHKSLIVRVGGYSEYFVRLSPALQSCILAKTEF